MWKAVFAVLLAVCLSPAAEKPLTNADVSSMIKGRLPQSTIVRSIELAGRRGAVQFDTSPAALIELKSEGAGERVLDAMLAAQAAAAAPGLPQETGVYLRTAAGWVELRPILLWPPFYRKGFSFSDKPYDIPISGPESRLRIAGRKPVFYVRGLRIDAGWQIVRLEQKDDRYSLRVRNAGAMSTTIRFEQSDAWPVELRTVADEVFTVAPTSDLAPGEYVLVSIPDGQNLLRASVFEITGQ